jgi:hypothetical protein
MFHNEIEHPFVGDLQDLTLDQLSEKINELHRKLGLAQRMSNAHLCDQIRLAINSYQYWYRKKIQEEADEDNSYYTKIDIT